MNLLSTRRAAFAAALTLFGLFAAPGGVRAQPAQATYYVVIHTPGPAWNSALDAFHQPGIGGHRGYWSQFQSGPLVMGGPFLDGSGGMMIIKAASIEAARQMAAGDPGVKSGLLVATVRPWLIGLRGSDQAEP